MQSAPYAVELRNISKRFGHVLANDQVSLKIPANSIHGIVGENGAGKSTTMSILYGFYQADAGDILINGEPATIPNSTVAIAQGIGMVHQHFMLVPTLSALENILLGAEQGFFLRKSKDRARQRLQDLMAKHRLLVDLDATVDTLAVSEQQRLEILKALYRDAKILILDEPTAVLTPQEVHAFFDILRELRAQGVTVIIITHKLHEVMELCDHVTVMRGGKTVAERNIGDTTVQELAELMVGRPVNMPSNRQPQAADAPLRLAVDKLCYRDANGITRLDQVSFTLHAGEILGVAGVSGNGQSELLSALSGLLRPEAGEMTVHTAAGEKTFNPQRWIDPRTMRSLNVALVPEDRLSQGLVQNFEMQESAILGYQHKAMFGPWWHLSRHLVEAHTQKLLTGFDVRPALPHLRTANMSGGNQQKLLLGREMYENPDILLVGQPTRGVDIGAIEQIYAALIAARNRGTAVLMVSVELEEIFALSDRIMVMNKGRISGIVEGGGKTSAAELGLLMTQHVN